MRSFEIRESLVEWLIGVVLIVLAISAVICAPAPSTESTDYSETTPTPATTQR